MLRNGTTGAILRLAIPAILTNIATPLMAMVDIGVVGHFGDASYIAAIAVGGAIFNMLYWVLNFLRTGTSGLTSQACGRRDMTLVADTLMRSMLIAATASILLLATSGAVCDGMMLFLNPQPEAAKHAQTYFDAAIWGAPAVLSTYVLSGWFVGTQDTRPILYMAIIANILNIVLNFFMVYTLHMGIAGVGTATALSQWLGLGIGVLFMRKVSLRLSLSFDLKRIFVRDGHMSRLFRINLDIFLRTLCLVTVTLWFTRAGAALGDVTLAANAVLMQLFMLFSFFMDGFAFAGEALAGLHSGSGNRIMLKATVSALLKLGLGLSILCSLVYFIAGQWIFSILTDSAQVIAMASDYRLWIVAVPLCGFMAFTWDGVYIGMTRTRLMLWSMALATCVYFGVYITCTPTFGNHGLWLAFICYLAVRGITQTIMFRRYISQAVTHASDKI